MKRDKGWVYGGINYLERDEYQELYFHFSGLLSTQPWRWLVSSGSFLHLVQSEHLSGSGNSVEVNLWVTACHGDHENVAEDSRCGNYIVACHTTVSKLLSMPQKTNAPKKR